MNTHPFFSDHPQGESSGADIQAGLNRPDPTPEDQELQRRLLLNAVGHLQAERFSEAFAVCDSLARLDPENRQLYLLRATLLSRLHRFKEAIANLDEALAIHPDYGIACLLRAYCHQANGDAVAADRDLQRALKLTEASMQVFCDDMGMTRTQFDAAQGLIEGERDYPRLFLSPEELAKLQLIVH
ncbi:MAG: hypothetical protein HQL95_04980 [Magnetococcales bacterium]|nr:hypothetical protein [Magnetococcales bacterium]